MENENMDEKAAAKTLAELGLAALPPELKGSHSEFGLKAILNGEDPMSIGIAIGEDGYKRNVKSYEPGGRFHPDTISPCCGRPNRECGAWQKFMTATQTIVETLDQMERVKSRARRDLEVEGLDPAIITRAEAGGEHESAEDFFRRINVDFESLPKQ
jgi:hypothetical protein